MRKVGGLQGTPWGILGVQATPSPSPGGLVQTWKGPPRRAWGWRKLENWGSPALLICFSKISGWFGKLGWGNPPKTAEPAGAIHPNGRQEALVAPGNNGETQAGSARRGSALGPGQAGARAGEEGRARRGLSANLGGPPMWELSCLAEWSPPGLKVKCIPRGLPGGRGFLAPGTWSTGTGLLARFFGFWGAFY